MNHKATIQSAITSLLDLFRSGEITEKIAITTNPQFDVPSSKWSLNNRLIQLVNGTMDSRGIKQWRQAGRKLKKGTKAIYILAPRSYETYQCGCGLILRNKELEKGICAECNKEINRGKIISSVFFNGIPVFRAEDTEGKPLANKN